MLDSNYTDQFLNTSALQTELETVEATEKRLEEAEKEELTISKKIKDLEKKIELLEEKLSLLDKLNRNQDTGKQSEIREQLVSVQKELSMLVKTRTDLQKKIKGLRDRVEKNFDKYKLFKNIRELANKKNVRLGQIEREAGCQAGYMSRLEKLDNTTDPTVEFVVTAAKELEVTIDLLIYSDFTDMTPTEIYVSKFIEQLIKDTRKDDLVWKSTSNGKELFRPLFETKKNPDTGKDVLVYNSYFFPEKKIDCSYKSYCAELGNGMAYICLIKCVAPNSESDGLTDFFEVYIVDLDEEVNPVFCTAQTGEAMITLVDRLYEEIEESIAHVHVNSGVKSIIDKYMKSKSDNKQ